MHLVPLFLALGSASAVRAQERREVSIHDGGSGQLSGVRDRLRSNAPRDIAWGAWLAAEGRMRTMVPALCAALRGLDRTEDLENELARAAVVDALVVLDAIMPAAQLGPVEPVWLGTDAHLILLARTPDGGPELLRWFRSRFATERFADARWLLVGNALVRDRAPGVALELLRTVELRVSVAVRDGAPRRPPLAKSGRCRNPSDFELPVDFPPLALWDLGTTPAPDRVLVADGAIPVFTRRRVHRGGSWQPEFEGSLPSIARQELYVAWLAALAEHSPADLGPTRAVDVQWSDAAHCIGEVERTRKDLLAAWAEVVGRLRARALLQPADEVFLRPDVVLHDLRRDRSTPLPTWR